MEYSKTTIIEQIGVQNYDNLPKLLKETLFIYCGISWDLHKCRIPGDSLLAYYTFV